MPTTESSFLVDCLKYKVGGHTEDRLTAIVTASFNHSQKFKKAFCRFLNINFKTDLLAKQQHKSKKSRPDLIISSTKGSIIAVIESKTESDINLKQLNHHSAIAARHYYFISKYPIDQKNLHSKWKSLRWSDLYLELWPLKNDFICNEVLKYLMEHDMIPPEQISKLDLENCALLLNSIRYSAAPDISNLLTHLSSLNKVAEILQATIREIIVENKKFAGKKPKVKLSFFYDHRPFLRAVTGKKKKTTEDFQKIHSFANVGLVVFFELPRKIKPFIALRLNSGLKINIGEKKEVSKNAELIAGLFNKDWTYNDEAIINFKKNRLTFYELKTQVKQTWI